MIDRSRAGLVLDHGRPGVADAVPVEEFTVQLFGGSD